MPKLSYEQAQNEVATVSKFIKFDKEKTRIRVVSEPYMSFRHKMNAADGKFINPACPNFDGRVFSIRKGRCPICDYITDSQLPQKDYEEMSAKKTIYFLVLNRENNQVQILEKWSVIKTILEHANDDDWGDPQGYDFTVTKHGQGKNTKYTTVASPKKVKLTEDEQAIVEASEIDLDKLTTPGTYAEIKARMDGEEYDSSKGEEEEVDIEDIELK